MFLHWTHNSKVDKGVNIPNTNNVIMIIYLNNYQGSL